VGGRREGDKGIKGIKERNKKARNYSAKEIVSL
jgi:hypothetical protein